MSPVPFLSKSRGIRNLVSRIRAILSRFGISARKYENLLRRFGAVANDLGCVPTLPITAVTLKRHPKVVRELSRQGIEFGVHGYIHTDYGVLSLEEQLRHFERAVDTFRGCHVPYTGFRAPFVRINKETFQALSHIGLLYDSSSVVYWDVLDRMKYSDDSWLEYQRVLEFYTARNAKDSFSLPISMNGFIEIPVTMPDDEIMIERLGITDKEEISNIWLAILENSYNLGELFTLQLHPERITLCESALEEVIQRAKQLNPAVWITTLREIATWWKERDNYSFEIRSGDNGEYNVKANCSGRAVILLKNGKVNAPTDEWFGGYRHISAREFLLESRVRPVIGLHTSSSQTAAGFLKSEGFIVEFSDKPEDYAMHFDNLADFDEKAERPLLQKIEQSDATLLRYWRWPDKARSALSITGDIDAMTLNDFALRIIENWQQRNR